MLAQCADDGNNVYFVITDISKTTVSEKIL